MDLKFSTKGVMNRNFGKITFYDNGTGDVKIIDHALYVKGTKIPIKRSLVPAAFREFVIARHSNDAYYELIFHINYDGSYKRASDRYCNIGDKVIGKFFEFGMGKTWYPPCDPEDPNF